jgi:hypothetical protein
MAVKGINQKIKGFLLLDGDNRNLPQREVSAQGLVVERWTRYESESYLVHPKPVRVSDFGDALF